MTGLITIVNLLVQPKVLLVYFTSTRLKISPLSLTILFIAEDVIRRPVDILPISVLQINRNLIIIYEIFPI